MEHHPDAYHFYTPDGHEQQYYPTPQIPPYHQVPPQPRHQLELQHQYHNYPFYPHPQPPSPSHASIEPSPPPSPDQMYSDSPISPQLSGSDTSADGIYSPQASPTSSRANSLVQRHGRIYEPTPSPTGSIPRRRRGRSADSDDEDLGYNFTGGENVATTRKEATRRQRIEAEQRRRDELRDGYAKLKDVLPVSNQKSSKVSLLDRATTHIANLELENKSLNDRITSLEEEIRHLKAIHDKLTGSLETPSPGMYERPLSPPPEVPTSAIPLMLPVRTSSLAGATELRDDPDTVTTPSDGAY
ncbi:hypothetical protein C8F01DRAFT_1077067 [Mycena amicta]|nr:hypothetical protein C8F01DRAFT_1077067 [Mycena amicta]